MRRGPGVITARITQRTRLEHCGNCPAWSEQHRALIAMIDGDFSRPVLASAKAKKRVSHALFCEVVMTASWAGM